MKWIRLFFPYRSHLESEVEYLRVQLAQRQRRIDEWQNAWVELTGKLTHKEPRGPAPALHTVKPRGWDAYRAANREEAETRSDAGSEGPAVNAGIAAEQAAN